MKFSLLVLPALVLLFVLVMPQTPHAAQKRVLLVVTTADQTINGKKTGIWLEEYVVPYKLFTKAGFAVTVASPKGGAAPVDPGSMKDGVKKQWGETITLLEHTKPLGIVSVKDFDAVFFPGGHGTMFDLPRNETIARLLSEFANEGKVIAAVCHGPAALVGVQTADGTPLVKGRTITGFTDREEAAAKMVEEVPFLLETELRKEGAAFIAGEMWASHVEVDGNMVTGQNPASSEATATAVIKLLSN